jgi:hypothetical protein
MNETPPSVVNVEIASHKSRNHNKKKPPFSKRDQPDEINLPQVTSGGDFPVYPGSISPEAFPVLTAFHQFLEAERARTKRRTTLLAVFLVVITTIFAATGAVIMSTIFFRHLKHDYDETRRQMFAVMEKTARSDHESVTAYETLKSDLLKLLKEVESTKEELITVLSTAKISTVSESVPITEEKINQVLTNLVLQIASRQSNLIDNEKNSPEAVSLAEEKKESITVGSLDTSRISSREVREADIPPVTVRIYEPFLLTLTPPGTTNAVSWYIPPLSLFLWNK